MDGCIIQKAYAGVYVFTLRHFCKYTRKRMPVERGRRRRYNKGIKREGGYELDGI